MRERERERSMGRTEKEQMKQWKSTEIVREREGETREEVRTIEDLYANKRKKKKKDERAGVNGVFKGEG